MNTRTAARVGGLGVIVLTACSTPPLRQEAAPVQVIKPPAAEPAPAPAAAAPAAAPTPAPAPQAELKHLMGRSLKPIPTRPLNVKASCSFRDPTGYRGTLQLNVKDAAVEKFEAEVTIPKHGACRFALKDFAQAERLPNVRLDATGGTCSVRMWEQGPRTTVAFIGCAAQCSGEAFDYLWPILVETKRGRCS